MEDTGRMARSTRFLEKLERNTIEALGGVRPPVRLVHRHSGEKKTVVKVTPKVAKRGEDTSPGHLAAPTSSEFPR